MICQLGARSIIISGRGAAEGFAAGEVRFLAEALVERRERYFASAPELIVMPAAFAGKEPAIACLGKSQDLHAVLETGTLDRQRRR